LVTRLDLARLRPKDIIMNDTLDIKLVVNGTTYQRAVEPRLLLSDFCGIRWD